MELSPKDRRILARACPFLAGFDDQKTASFEQVVAGFLGQTTILGQGIEVDHAMKLEIAGWAARLVLGHSSPLFILSIVRCVWIHPGDQVRPGIRGQMRSGSHYGHVHVSWGTRKVRSPLVLHEFAHALDLLDRRIDDDPGMFMMPPSFQETWRRFFNEDFILRARSRKSWLTPWELFKLSRWGSEYGRRHRGEMFAVSTEWFFTRPLRLQAELPELYEVLCLVYNQDPAFELFLAPIVLG